MRTQRDREALRRLAERQAGRVTRRQLNFCGVDNTMVDRWIARGILIRCLPKVYALGHTAPSLAARPWEAILYAGPGAMLSHMTAAQWCGHIKYGAAETHVSTPRKIASLPGQVVVHARRELPRRFTNGLPVTTIAQTLTDLATQRPDLVPRALSQLDYMDMLDSEEIAEHLGSGVRGAAAVRRALTTYDPNFARLNDELEIEFYEQCREWGIDPLPVPNVEVAPRLIIDALWPDRRFGVELDSQRNHGSPAQLLHDANRDIAYRHHGLIVVRYRTPQIRLTPDDVRTDLIHQLEIHRPHRRD